MRKSFLWSCLGAGLVLAACQDRSQPTQPNTEAVDAGLPPALALVNSWSPRAPMPAGRESHAAEAITGPSGDALVYVFGGLNPDPNHESIEERTVQVYNYRTDSWSTRTPSPFGIARTNGVGRIEGMFYLPGGGVPAQGPDLWLKSLYRYDASLDRWTRLTDMPHASGLGVSGVINGKLLVLTGYDNQYLSDGQICEAPDGTCRPVPTRRFYRYDPVTNTWQNRAWCPNFHLAGAAGVIDGKLYVVGGGDRSGISRKLDIYDPATNTWRAGAPMPAARTEIAGAVAGMKLFVLGGHGPGGDSDQTYVYDPQTNHWATRASMPTPRVRLVAAKITVDGKAQIVTLGGEEQSALVPTGTTNEVYTPW